MFNVICKSEKQAAMLRGEFQIKKWYVFLLKKSTLYKNFNAIYNFFFVVIQVMFMKNEVTWKNRSTLLSSPSHISFKNSHLLTKILTKLPETSS